MCLVYTKKGGESLWCTRTGFCEVTATQSTLKNERVSIHDVRYSSLRAKQLGFRYKLTRERNIFGFHAPQVRLDDHWLSLDSHQYCFVVFRRRSLLLCELPLLTDWRYVSWEGLDEITLLWCWPSCEEPWRGSVNSAVRSSSLILSLLQKTHHYMILHRRGSGC